MNQNFKCEECGSTHICENHSGYVVCCQCGLVINEKVFQLNQTAITHDENGKLISSNAKVFNSTLIGNSKERLHSNYSHLQHIHAIMSQNKVDIAFNIIAQLKAQFEVSLDTEHFLVAFQKLFEKIPPYTKSRNVRIFTTTIFILVCRKNAFNLSLQKILEYMQIRLRDYYEVVKQIRLIDSKFFELDVQEIEQIAEILIGRIVPEFNLTLEHAKIARFLIKHYRHQLGEKIQIITGAAIGISMKIIPPNVKITNFAISKALGVTASTIYTRVKSFPILKFQRYWEKKQKTTSMKTMKNILIKSTQSKSSKNKQEFAVLSANVN